MTTPSLTDEPYLSPLANLRASLRRQPEPARAAADAVETVVSVPITEPDTGNPPSADAATGDPVKVPTVAKKRTPAKKAAVAKK